MATADVGLAWQASEVMSTLGGDYCELLLQAGAAEELALLLQVCERGGGGAPWGHAGLVGNRVYTPLPVLSNPVKKKLRYMHLRAVVGREDVCRIPWMHHAS